MSMMMRHNLPQHAKRVLAHSSRNRLFCSCANGTLTSPATSFTLQSRIETASDRKAVLEQWRQQQGNKLNPSLVRGTIEKLRDSQKYRQALDVSNWMIEHNICSFVPEDYAARFHLIDNVLGLEEAEKFLESVPENLRGESLYTALLNSYATRSGRKALDKAEPAFKKMRELGLLLRVSPYSSMTSLYRSIGNREKVDEILREMEESEIEFDSLTVNSALRVYAAVSDVATMEKFLADWEKNATLEWHTRLDMAKAYLREGILRDAKEMLRRTEKLNDPESYEELMRLYGEVGKREDVYRIWDKYKETRPLSNEGFRAMIGSLLKFDDIKGAENIFGVWRECSSGLEFDARIPTLLASHYREKGMVNKAYKLMNKTMSNREFARPITPFLEEWGKRTNPSDLRDLIKSLIDSNQLSKALEASTWMGEKTVINLFPEEYAARLHTIENVLGLKEAEKFFERSIPEDMKDESVYTSLLSSYSKYVKTLNKAEATFKKMGDLGFLSSPSPYNSMISLYSQLGRRSEVESLVRKMKEKNMEPDNVGMNNVLRLYADETNIGAMEKYKIDADKLEERTAVAMGKAYERAGMLTKAMEITRSREEVYRLWNEYKEKEETGNEGYRSVISSLLRLDDVKGAEEVYGEWEQEGPEFDSRIQALLISRYCEENDEKKVRVLVDSSRKKRKQMEFDMLVEKTNGTVLFVGFMASMASIVLVPGLLLSVLLHL
ncbi:unnamed protein product [Microthlaspi erraticum]|uniref:Pentacotripeptide-repeat region of PRORP domain-containing protein n=1 Tax=Microthlaspi erraticum TaxID=1685480 RepID=A0A6D2KQB9_9BRAS|nr:unnamed protein product [Microthlaspi erraticum]